jgi:hypothetical protein
MGVRTACCILILLATAFCGSSAVVCAQEAAMVSPAESYTEDSRTPLTVQGLYEEVLKFDGMEVHLVVGRVSVIQGELSFSASRMALFVAQTGSGYDTAIYGEDVRMTSGNGQRAAGAMAFRLESTTAPQFRIQDSASSGSSDHPLLRRALSRLYPGDPGTATTASLQSPNDEFSPPVPNLPAPGPPTGARRVQIRPRSSTPLRVESSTTPDTVPEERVTVITGGVNVLVDGLDTPVEGMELTPGLVDLSADRVVIWTQGGESDALESGSTVVQPADARFQVYLEGNIVIRQKQNSIRATHGFFDAAGNRALLLNAELRAFVPTTGSDFRIRGERMRQLSRDRFHVQNAWATTSPYGKPGYRLQASDIFVEQGPSMFTGVDPLSGQQVLGNATWVTSLNNQLVLGDTPVFYLPKVSGPAEDPGIPIRGVTLSQDRIFGLQVNTVWDLRKLLGLPRQPGQRFDLLADYRSKRGPGAGIRGEYTGENQAGRWLGNGTLYYQYDSGLDNLGLDRRRLTPESDHRGEAVWRHRQELPDESFLFGEIGFLSDRNYLEQYHENRFDSDKDAETLLGLRKDLGAWSGQIWGRGDLSGFEANTQWLPRGDLSTFSLPLFDGAIYWSQHSSAGYADMQTLQTPSDPLDRLTLAGLPYMTNASGTVAMTRHELAAPVNVGPVTFEPFVVGEAAYWESDFSGNSMDRWLASTGLRARMTATKLFPFARSPILGVNGLAHIHDTMLEYSWTDSSRSLSDIPQFNEIDENSQERFRSRYTLPSQIFPGAIPAQFNPRNFAMRNGAALWTSAPWHEVADNLQALRISFRDRLQTKAGPLDNPRIRDWMVWDYGATFFPQSDRDNFGEDFGLFYSHYRWNFSDRTSLLTDASFDIFDDAASVWSVGVLTQRGLRGSLYAGIREVNAGRFLKSQTLVSSYSYQMSPKWISTASFAYDLAESEARGTSLTLSRVGLDWILHFGFGLDVSKDNVGVGVSLEPRFGPPSPTNLAWLLGIQ